MNKFIALIFILFSLNALAETNFIFLNQKDASDFLSTSDDFTQNLTPLDLALHHATKNTMTEVEQLNFLKKTSLAWSESEIALINNEIETIKNAIITLGINLNLPSEIKLIKTNGSDEFNSHYTRGNAIIFPANSEGKITTDVATFVHEIFHIMTRHNPHLVDGLYALCNFSPINRIKIPESIKDIALTNPDAFYYDHAITVHANGLEINIIPFFYSAIKQTEITGPVDEATTFKLGLLDLATLNDPQPKMYKTSETDYKDQALTNSHYYIHPEEIMAENFRLLLTNSPAKHSKVLENLKEFLKKF